MMAYEITMADLQPIVMGAVSEVLSTMFMQQPRFLRSTEADQVPASITKNRSISGLIALIQTMTLEGTVSVGFTSETTFNLLGQFYGESITRLDDPKILGGIGELTNMIHGIIKQKLNEKGFQFEMTLPIVVVGTNHQCFNCVAGKSCSFEFEIDSGFLSVEVFLHRAEKYRLEKQSAGVNQ